MEENKKSEVSQLVSRLGEWASEGKLSRAAFTIVLDSSSGKTADLLSTCVGHRLFIAAMIAKYMVAESESHGMAIRMAMKMAENPDLLDMVLDLTGPSAKAAEPFLGVFSTVLKDVVRGVPGASEMIATLVNISKKLRDKNKEGDDA